MLISIARYAKEKGLAPVTVRQKCARGNLSSAEKIAGRWVIEESEPYIDTRFKACKCARKKS